MLRNRISLIIALAFISLLTSCAKEGPTGPVGPIGPNYTGTISGHTTLYDQYGNQVLTNLDSTYLTLTGVTVASTAVTYTDINGAYSFFNTYTGDYMLTANHTGYANTQLNSFPYLLGDLNKDVKMTSVPDSFITSFKTIHNAGSLYDSLVITATPDPLPRNCIIFLNNNSNVNNYYINGYLLAFVINIAPNVTTVTKLVPQDALINAGFTSGVSMVYYAAYSYVINDASVYEDLSTGKNVYNAVNANPIIDSAIAP